MGSFAKIGPVATATYTYHAYYAYSQDVVQNDNVLRIMPREGGPQTNATYAVSIDPGDWFVEYMDRFGNRVRRSSVTRTHRFMEISAHGAVDIQREPPVVADIPPSFYRESPPGMHEFLTQTPLITPAALSEHAAEAAQGAGSLIELVTAVIEWLHRNIVYEFGHTSVDTTADEAVSIGYGVCQDFAHATIGMLRALGIPTRYVSGLLCSQVGETHAWIEFYHPNQGWLTADPTRMRVLPAPTELLAFAVGRDYSDVPPVTGSFVSSGQGGLTLVATTVHIDEKPSSASALPL